MDWIFDHLQVLIAAAAAVAYWLNQRRQEQADSEQEPETRFERDEPGSADEAERARRIREEIRRKIAERAGGGQVQTAPAPPPLYRRETAAPATTPTQSAADVAMLEHQRRLQEQLQALKPAQSSSVLPLTKPRRTIVQPMAGGLSLKHELRSQARLRRAIVLREVLGPPVGLR